MSGELNRFIVLQQAWCFNNITTLYDRRVVVKVAIALVPCYVVFLILCTQARHGEMALRNQVSEMPTHPCSAIEINPD